MNKATGSNVFPISNPDDFRKINLDGWNKNYDFWIESNKTHIDDIKDTLIELVYNLKNQSGDGSYHIYDFGCGDGWVYKLLKNNKAIEKINYSGFDYFAKFIKFLKRKYSEDSKSFFYKYDLERVLPERFNGKANLVIAAFNFFEMPDMEAAIANASKCLKSNGVLILITIDPVMQLLSVSSDMENFRKNLAMYQKHGPNLGYRKTIDIQGELKQKEYCGILYSISDYIKSGQKHKLDFYELREIKQLNRIQPQIYQFLLFEK